MPMNYYVIQVRTGEEEQFLRRVRPSINQDTVRILWPRRRLSIRRRGRTQQVMAPIFPGYVFAESPQIDTELYWAIRRADGFLRFLPDNHDVRPLVAADRKLLLHFLSFGEVVEKSKVSFSEDARIHVLEGPLKGLEGRIVKVDRRKGRAKVKLDLYNESFLVDFGFQSMQPVADISTSNSSSKTRSTS